MIIAKIMDYESLKISNKPEGHIIYRTDKQDYYLGRGTYDKGYIGGDLKPELSYYYAIKIKIMDEIINIFDEDTYFLSFDESGNIKDKVWYVPEHYDFKYVRDPKEGYLWQLFVTLDLDSIKGRKVLLQNYFPDFNSNIGNIPESLKIPTKKSDTAFCIQEKGIKREFVSLDRVVGFTHSRYEGHSWIEAFCYLKRWKSIYYSFTESQYYDDIESGDVEPSGLEFIKIDDEYYVSSGAHRVTIAKLKNKEGIYAPVSYYSTSKFHKEYYEKLINLGFEVELGGNENTYYNILTEYDYKNEWEVFEVGLNGERILLFNKEMIYQFYSTFIGLDVSDKAIKFREYYKGFKTVYSILFSKKYYDNDDKWYDNYVTSAIENFFIKNNKMISEHKKSLNKDKE